jgi:outer membrane scaffolding protein for murein synthesis (MipA/OmpV family)
MNRLFTNICLAIGLTSTAQAQQLRPEWELGVVGLAMTQQAYPGSSYHRPAALIAPLLIYRGKFLRAGQSGVGLRAIDLPGFELDVGFAGSFGSNSSNIPVRRGMPNLGSLVEFGPRGKWYLSGRNTQQTAWVELPVRGVFDIGNHAKWIGVTAEPQLAYETSFSAWKLSGSVGALLGNRDMNQHFYSVDPAYTNQARPAYQAQAGLIAWKAGLTASYRVSPQLSLFGFTRLNSTSASKNHNSPLVDKTNGVNYGVGLAYTFFQSGTMVER